MTHLSLQSQPAARLADLSELCEVWARRFREAGIRQSRSQAWTATRAVGRQDGQRHSSQLAKLQCRGPRAAALIMCTERALWSENSGDLPSGYAFIRYPAIVGRKVDGKPRCTPARPPSKVV
jgi:hypothetical protein